MTIPPEEQATWPAVRGARLRQVIEVEFNHGAGDEGDPVRRVVAYFAADGDGCLLAWADVSDGPRRIDPSFMAKGWRA